MPSKKIVKTTFKSDPGELVKINRGDLVEFPLTSENYREYEFGEEDNRYIYRIDNPVALFLHKRSDGKGYGDTHRVLDYDGVVHCVPAPGGRDNCVIRWKSIDPTNPLNF